MDIRGILNTRKSPSNVKSVSRGLGVVSNCLLLGCVVLDGMLDSILSASHRLVGLRLWGSLASFRSLLKCLFPFGIHLWAGFHKFKLLIRLLTSPDTSMTGFCGILPKSMVSLSIKCLSVDMENFKWFITLYSTKSTWWGSNYTPKSTLLEVFKKRSKSIGEAVFFEYLESLIE